MWPYLWWRLPGPAPVKAVILLIAAVAIFLLLMEVVFPWVSAQMPYQKVAVS
ncbi:membrane protein [Corynebacterium atypicum]|uniref:Membrane protein n=1 Tax=Corynebacterium atypicum TaxID=191610 RepID=A0ABM5QPV5_9CORY|nr:hypothetical protein [Corynebacterium atypicum]AIG64842.1 membrane protein [Corynebacterium atypicum]